MENLLELDSLSILVIIDNELDPISPNPNPNITQTGGLKDISARHPLPASDPRGPNLEAPMESICCSAHGLSLLLTGTLNNTRHSILFDTGPEPDAWERNVTRLAAPIDSISLIHLSHWHRDHSGGLTRALSMIHAASHPNPVTVTVDLHPARPDFRGMQPPNSPVVSFQPDPTFAAITDAGGTITTSTTPHTVCDGFFGISGEIPRTTPYELGLRYGVRFNKSTAQWTPDETIVDERLVVCRIKGKGLVVFTGCSHAGVVNVARHALELAGGEEPLYAVVGGFHLADAQPEVIERTVRDLKALGPRVLLAGHCTGWRAKFEMQRSMPGVFVPCFVGSMFEL